MQTDMVHVLYVFVLCLLSYVLTSLSFLCPFSVPLHALSTMFSPSVFSQSSFLACLPLSASVFSFMLSPLCIPLIISPVVLPPLSPPAPHSLISVSVYISLGFPCSRCRFFVWCCVRCSP